MEEAKITPKLSKKKTLRAFETMKKLTLNEMTRQEAVAQDQSRQMNQNNETEMMIDMFVDQAKIEDSLFIKEEVSNEEVEEAMMFFIGKNDPEVK